MDTTLPSRFLRRTFYDGDRIAIVTVHRPSGRLIQRLEFVSVVAGRRWQAWLRYLNAHEHDVYYSVNVYDATARGRKKADVHAIRHLFLDVDGDAERTLESIESDSTLPPPHHIVRSSPDRCQILWRVAGFSVITVEALQHHLAAKHGADRAATDAARVARLPGFWNCKYEPRPFVTLTSATRLDPYGLAKFPFPADVRGPRLALQLRQEPRYRGTALSQSERDWSWVTRQLAAGRPIEQVEALLMHRRPDKRNPSDYAARTVDAAWADLSLAAGEIPEHLVLMLTARRRHRPNVETYARHIVDRATIRSASRRSRSTTAAIHGGRDVNNQHDA